MENRYTRRRAIIAQQEIKQPESNIPAPVEQEQYKRRRQRIQERTNPPPAPPKGVCPKCQKHIGRGVHFHVKHCKG